MNQTDGRVWRPSSLKTWVETAIVRFYTLGGQYSSDWGEIMAAAVIIVAPMVAFFLFMQRRFIEGMASGSVKG